MPPTLAAAAAGAGGVPSTGGSASGGAWCSKWGYRLYTRCMMRRPMAVVFNCTECGKMASVKCNAGESRGTSKRVRDHMKDIYQFNNRNFFTIKRSTNSKRSHQIKKPKTNQTRSPPNQQDPKQIKTHLVLRRRHSTLVARRSWRTGRTTSGRSKWGSSIQQ